MVPHIVRGNDVSAANLRPIDPGLGTNVELRHIVAEGPDATARRKSARLDTLDGSDSVDRRHHAGAERYVSCAGRHGSNERCGRGADDAGASAQSRYEADDDSVTHTATGNNACGFSAADKCTACGSAHNPPQTQPLKVPFA